MNYWVKPGFFLILALIMTGYFISVQEKMSMKEEITRLLQFYVSEIQNKTLEKNEKVAVGYAGDMDIVVDALELLNILGYSTPPTPIFHSELNNLSDFVETFAYFFKEGSGVEYFLKSKSDFNLIIEKSIKIAKLKEMGGNGNVMALRAYQEGCKVLLASTIDEGSYRDLFNSEIELTFPPTENMTDIHLVLDYSQSAKWGNLTAKRTNRFYLNHDIENIHLNFLDAFHEKINSFGPDLSLIGGLHLFNNVDPNHVEKIFQKIRSKIEIEFAAKKTKLHLELGSFSNKQNFKFLFDWLMTKVHSIGMNEQELSFMINFLLNRDEQSENSLVDMNEIFGKIMTLLKKFEDYEMSNLERIQFHSLNLHLICQRVRKQGSHWGSPRPALIKSVIVALQTCNHEDSHAHHEDFNFDPEKMDFKHPEYIYLPNYHTYQIVKRTIDPDNPYGIWRPSKDWECEYTVSPNWVSPVRTRGLGDNISSSGIIYHKIIEKRRE